MQWKLECARGRIFGKSVSCCIWPVGLHRNPDCSSFSLSLSMGKLQLLLNGTYQHHRASSPTTMRMDSSSCSNSSDDCSVVKLYVVQKCWFSGAQVMPAVDYLRLLETKQQAEQVAYHSAHLWGNGSVVRTIQLPHQGGYGFVSAGSLFWVREIAAIATTTTTTTRADRYGEAHAIIRHGILGGTGNANSRRGMEDVENVVFVGPHSAHRALQQLTALSSPLPNHARLQWLPVGPPAHLQQLQTEWPDHASWKNQHTESIQATTSTSMMQMMDDDSSGSKRFLDDSENDGKWNRNNDQLRRMWAESWYNGSNTDHSNAAASSKDPSSSCSYETTPRPAKRACIHNNSNFWNTSESWPMGD